MRKARTDAGYEVVFHDEGEEVAVRVEVLLRLCWLIANAEAMHLGATEIQPLHFLLGVMKIIDPKFPEQLDKLDVSSDEWAAMCKSAQSIRRYIDVRPDRVMGKRRRLRARLAEGQVLPYKAGVGMLHRSESLKRAFHDACLFEDGAALSLKALVQSMFELDLVSLDDIKG